MNELCCRRSNYPSQWWKTNPIWRYGGWVGACTSLLIPLPTRFWPSLCNTEPWFSVSSPLQSRELWWVCSTPPLMVIKRNFTCCSLESTSTSIIFLGCHGVLGGSRILVCYLWLWPSIGSPGRPYIQLVDCLHLIFFCCFWHFPLVSLILPLRVLDLFLRLLVFSPNHELGCAFLNFVLQHNENMGVIYTVLEEDVTQE